MSENRKKRSVLFWIITAIGIASLVLAAAITAAFLLLPTIGMPFSTTKYPEAPSLAPVTGTVTLDGKPLKYAIIKYVPIVDSPPRSTLPAPTSIGITDGDGKYTLTYATENGKPVMGAVIGPHQVQIVVNDPSGKQAIPASYSTPKSGLKANVKIGMPPVDFALKSEPAEVSK
jgi:hypothetical protein